MAVTGVTDIVLLAVLAIGVWMDIATGKVRNYLTVPAAMCGPVIHLAVGGSQAAIQSLQGMAWMLLAAFLLFVCHFVRGGDAKLLVAVGALGGVSLVRNVLLFSALAGGVMAMFVLLRRLGIVELVRRTVLVLRLTAGSNTNPGGVLDGKRSRLPYAVAIAAGTLSAMIARQ